MCCYGIHTLSLSCRCNLRNQNRQNTAIHVKHNCNRFWKSEYFHQSIKWQQQSHFELEYFHRQYQFPLPWCPGRMDDMCWSWHPLKPYHCLQDVTYVSINIATRMSFCNWSISPITVSTSHHLDILVRWYVLLGHLYVINVFSRIVRKDWTPQLL